MARRAVKPAEPATGEVRTSAEQRTGAMFPEWTRDALGVATVKCQCGLHQGVGIYDQKGGKCIGCGRQLPAPPDEMRGPSSVAGATPAMQQAAQAQRRAEVPPPADAPAVGTSQERKPVQTHAGAFTGPILERHDHREVDPAGDPADEGTVVTVTAGRELYSPLRFETYEVGPFTAQVRTRAGESIEQAAARAMRALDAVMAAARVEKRGGYFREKARLAADMAAMRQANIAAGKV